MEQLHYWSCIIGLLCILQTLRGTQGTTYEILGDDTTLNIVCSAAEDRGNTPIRQILDISSVSFDMAADLETLYFNGDIKVLKDVPNIPIGMQVDIFRRERSEWIPTPLAMKRDNLCQSLSNPMELWYPIFMKVPKEEFICPPTKGHVYSLANVSNHVFVRNMPRMDIAGDVKAVVHLTSGDMKTCAVLFFKIYASNH
ncbi:uncharacterized protein LOC6550046 [Drosophila erecta]|uniref:MD-2-related lipid-recognition domain-containing protein n=1 Tax=Drosophila erecta TaxID=7220 RepID=B3NWA0_DROER|nr:uncharacterized protein LOC6550046 [Drosophila erecta]EDV46439.1 uncharacterized protein Dere_GG19089 [Drosophila erecta]